MLLKLVFLRGALDLSLFLKICAGVTEKGCSGTVDVGVEADDDGQLMAQEV